MVEVAVATTDGPPQGRVAQLAAASPWNSFPAGDPHPDDWFEVSSGVLDATLRVPPGRHAYVRVRLTGDGTATPQVHQIRLDLPRRTSLDDLPAVFAGDLDARDFTERFVTLFDAQLEQVDETVGRLPALLDAAALPDDALTWLAGLLGLGFEAVMTVAQRRALIAAAPDLYRRRGTPSGLVRTLAVALGITAIVEELGPQRPWGAAGDARLGMLRLFGRSRARVRLGTSQLGRAPLISSGNPDDDARLAGANRIVVSVPPNSDRELVERVVRSQTPAHVVATVQMRAPGFVLTDLRLGIDTVVAAPAPAVVGTVRPRAHRGAPSRTSREVARRRRKTIDRRIHHTIGVTKVPEATENQTVNSPPATACGHVPDFTRLRYFHGRALGALDLRREQAYFLEKDRLRNRMLHGWGIVCGLGVELVAPVPCDPTDQSPATTTLAVAPGAALDPRGNEIVVRNPRHVIVEKLLSAADHSALAATPGNVYLTLGYHEQPIDPTRPLLSAACEAVPACEYGRVCETYRICASTTAPDPGPACEPCCGGAGHDGEPHSREIRGGGAQRRAAQRGAARRGAMLRGLRTRRRPAARDSHRLPAGRRRRRRPARSPRTARAGSPRSRPDHRGLLGPRSDLHAGGRDPTAPAARRCTCRGRCRSRRCTLM